MAAVTHSPRKPLLSAVVSAFESRARAGRKPSRLAAVAVKLRQHLPTLAALASFDTAGWLHGSTAGLLVTGVCVLVADFAVTGR